jgi:hypothetical protein
MCIGIIYDAYNNDSWHRIEKDVPSVRTALKTIKLPLPVACIFDTSSNDFIEFNEAYKPYRPELLKKARTIFQGCRQAERNEESNKPSKARRILSKRTA